jgi:hypothetical protein
MPLKEGYAVKRGSHGFFASFVRNKRYFVLADDGFFYTHARDASDQKGKRIDVYLSSFDLKAPTALEIVTGDRSYPLEFASLEERDAWHTALLAAQRARAQSVETLVSRLEGALERAAAKGNVTIARGGKQSTSMRTPAEFIERFEVLTQRLEKLVRDRRAAPPPPPPPPLEVHL